MSVYLPEPDRKYYLSCSQNTSLDPKNVSFLRASRELTVMDSTEQQPGCEQEQQQSNQISAALSPQQAQVSEQRDISFQPPVQQQQQQDLKPQQPTVQHQFSPVVQHEIRQQDVLCHQTNKETPLNVVQTHHQNQPMVSLQYDKPKSPKVEQQPGETLINGIDFEEYRNFLAFREQMKQQRERDRLVQQQTQDVTSSRSNKRPLDENYSSSFQTDKRQKEGAAVSGYSESSQWQTRMDDMLTRQSETFNMKALIGSIQGFFAQNNRPSQPPQQPTGQQLQQQPHQLAQQVPPNVELSQQKKYTPYYRTMPYVRLSHYILMSLFGGHYEAKWIPTRYKSEMVV